MYAGAAALLYIAHGFALNIPRPALQVYLLALAGAYFVYCWTHGGQTLPMKTWRIRLRTCSGDALTLRTALQRYLLALLGLSLCGLTVLWALLDADGQYLHDRLVGTRLVRA